MKNPLDFFRKQEPDQLCYRKLSVKSGNGQGPSTWDEKTRSVNVVAATENPVMVFDPERWQVVPEVLLMSGARLPISRKIPLLDSHNRGTSGDVLGSARNLDISGTELHARAQFSDKTAKAREVAGLVADGDVEDFSIGYRVNRSVWIPEGETQIVDGRSFTGPLKVSADWTPRELSATPIGADEAAKARSERNDMFGRKNEGLEPRQPQTPQPAGEELIRAERQRISELTGLCGRFNADHMLQQFVDNGTSIEDAQRAVMSLMAGQPAPSVPGFRALPVDEPYGRVSMGRDAAEKRREAIIDGFAIRAGCEIEKPADGWREYANTSMVGLAEECLRADGVSTRGLPKDRIVTLALQQRAMMTDDFSSLLSGVMGKVLRTSYEQTPSTWQAWCRITQGTDFKEMSRVALSEAPSLEEVPEHSPYTYGGMSDNAEKFQIYTFGRLFAITRQALVNDDLAGFSRLPMAWAGSAKRKISSLVYGILTSNPAMADGKTLFHADHNNMGTGGEIAVTTLTEARKSMRLQTGLQGEILNIQPAFLIVPASLETDADVLLNSISLDTTNPAIVNPFRGKLQPVVEPLLDASDVHAWYVAAAPNAIDTVEVCFLNGRQAPVVEQREGWEVAGIEFRATLDVGVKAIDYRSLFYNAGQ